MNLSCCDDDADSEFLERDPTGRYGRYSEVLGKGAFKTVYKGFDEIDGIEVAWNQVKVPEVSQSKEDLDRLYSEIHLLKTLKHKNIIKFYHSWVDMKAKNINFITEIFTSGTLRQYRKRHKHADIKAVKNWSRQILRGLLYLHSHDPPIIHRDLKCDNVFVNGSQGEVKIGDLGLATILQQAKAAHSVIGTPEFMAPELYEEEYTELVDIYSFGMCLLEMVTFEYPYSECANAAQIYKKVSSVHIIWDIAHCNLVLLLLHKGYVFKRVMNKGKKPEALNKVKDPSLREFIEQCIAPVSKRLPARELLMDPFLQLDPQKDGAKYLSPKSLGGSDKGSFIDLSVFTEDNHIGGSSTRNLGSNMVEAAVVPKLLSGSTNAAAKDGPMDQNNNCVVLTEGAGKNIDFKVEGKRREDDTVFLHLQIADSQGHMRMIHFPFDIEVDTAMTVASEMVAELDITDQDVTKIAEMIDAAVLDLVPEWKPGVSIEESYTADGGGEAMAGVMVQSFENGGQSRVTIDTDHTMMIMSCLSSESSLTGPTLPEPSYVSLDMVPSQVEGSAAVYGRFEEVRDEPCLSIFSDLSDSAKEVDYWDRTEGSSSISSPVTSSFLLDSERAASHCQASPRDAELASKEENTTRGGGGGVGDGGGGEAFNDLVESQRKAGIMMSFDHETWTNIGPGRPPESLSNASTQPPVSSSLDCDDLAAAQEEEKLLALKHEQELRELQQKHDEDMLELRRRWNEKRSLSSISSSSWLSLPLSKSEQEICDRKYDASTTDDEHLKEIVDDLKLRLSLREIKTVTTTRENLS